MVQVRDLHQVTHHSAIKLDSWLQKLQQTTGLADVSRIRQACEMADQAQSQTDKHNWSIGNSFYVGLEMAEILTELKLDEDSLVAAILYRSVRELKLELAHVAKHFGQAVADLIAGVIQMAAITGVLDNELSARHGKKVLGEHQDQADNIRKMLVTLVNDVRVALIKLAERACAIRAAKNAESEKRLRVANEVFHIYAPLAHRLGIGHIKWELEDMAFRYLEPDNYKKIAGLLDERRLDRDRYITEVIKRMEAEILGVGINAHITGRSKHIYSIWRKMKRKNISFSEVYDVRAVRILVPAVQDCYAVLGIVHSLWRHIPREFDDYIATPKKNGYQSLHTAVIGPEGKALEVQIRSFDMHEEAEFGVCSHWQYKGSDKASAGRSYEEKIEWLRQVLLWHEELGDLGSLVDELRNDIEPDRIYVFTPAGHIVDLSHGTTPIDFAYRVHTEVGHHCRGAKVNGRIVPLTYQLQTGEQVEILTSPSSHPSRDWLNSSLGYVHSSRARAKIQHWFKLQDKDKNIEAGRDMVTAELQRLALTAIDLEWLAPQMNYKAVDDMYAAVGAGDLRLAHIMTMAQRKLEKPVAQGQLNLTLPTQFAESNPSADLDFAGVDGLLSHAAGCCQPVPGDECSGYVTLGRGVSIHRKGCANLRQLEATEPDRIIPVQWNRKPHSRYAVDVQVRAFDRSGLLRDITTVLANEATNVIDTRMRWSDDRSLVDISLTLEVPDIDVLGKVLAKIGQLSNVIDVKRYRQR